MNPPTRSYAPIPRPGSRRGWPPDDSWTIGELAAELAFWRNLAALAKFAHCADPKLRITPFIQPLPAVVVPQQRKSPDPRYDQYKQAGMETHRLQERQRELKQRGYL